MNEAPTTSINRSPDIVLESTSKEAGDLACEEKILDGKEPSTRVMKNHITFVIIENLKDGVLTRRK